MDSPAPVVTTEGRDEHLLAELEKRQRELEAVLHVSNALFTKTSLDELIRDALELSMRTVRANAGSIILYDQKKDKLVFRYVLGPAAPQLTGLELNPDQGICGQVFQTGEPKISDDPTKEKRHLRTVGEQVHYITKNMVSVPLKSIAGKPIGVMQILNKEETNFDQEDLDLVTIMAAQAATALENARLHEEAKLAVVVNLMGDISHDIKNLVTPVTTCTQTLEMMWDQMLSQVDELCQENQDSLPELVQRLNDALDFLRGFFHEAAEMILDGATRTQERVREIADCVKGIIATPKFELHDVNDVIEKVTKYLRVVADKKQIKIVTEGLGEVPPILIDQKQLYNAIYNLISNAIPETPDGGQISVRTHASSDGRAFPDGSFLMIEVADTGHGMPEEVKARLFSDQAISTKPGGTGLGTRIVKNVVDAHQGVITVESEQGVGTTFFMKLPLRTELPPQEEEKELPASRIVVEASSP